MHERFNEMNASNAIIAAMFAGLTAASLGLAVPAHADPNPPHTPSYYQGKGGAKRLHSSLAIR
jgi:hypothetical protein